MNGLSYGMGQMVLGSREFILSPEFLTNCERGVRN